MFKYGEKVTSYSRGGCSFKNDKLVIDDNIAVIKPTFHSYAFEGAFHLASIIALLFIGSILLEANTDDSMQGLNYLIGFCIGFSGLTRLTFFVIRKRKFFDLNQKLFYVERAAKEAVAIDDITILQLINKDVYAKEKSFSCSELCLVTRTGKRIMILNHGDFNEAVYESEQLATFLSKPLERLRDGEVYSPSSA